MGARRVVVIGAGVIGAALALRLAERRSRVTLVDAGRPGEGTSGSSFAWLNANNKTPRAYFELNRSGMRAHRALATELGGTWFRPVGNLEWAAAEDDLARLHARVARLCDWGYPAGFLSVTQATELEPGLRVPEDVSEVACFPDEGFVLTAQLVDRLVARAIASDATVISGDPVVGFDLDRGRVTAARLASGDRLRGDVFVCCAGWRTARLAALAGVKVPLVSPEGPASLAPGLVAHTTPGPVAVQRVIHAPDLNVRPARGGRLLLEAGDVDRAVSVDAPTEPVLDAAATLLRRARRLLPALGERDVERARICIRPLPADGYPIVGWAPRVEGCYVAVTHSGVTLAPYLARLVSGEILHGEHAAVLAPFRPDRFAANNAWP